MTGKRDMARWTEGPARRSSASRRRRLLDAFQAYLFILPACLILFAFQYLPAYRLFRLSLTDRLLLSPKFSFVGLENYQRLIEDDRFWNAAWNTLYYVLGSAPIQTALALTLALALARRIRGVAAFRTIFFLPVVASLVAMATIWQWIYHPNPSVGILNYLLGLFGAAPIDWLGDPAWAMPSIIFLTIWSGTGYYMVIYLAGVLDIPDVYYEAARIDGANGWQMFRNVTWPLLAPTTFLILVLQTINSFQVFSQVYVMTGGGPVRSTEVLVYYIYQRAFQSLEFGYASTIAIVFFLFLLVMAILQRVLVGSRVGYER